MKEGLLLLGTLLLSQSDNLLLFWQTLDLLERSLIVIATLSPYLSKILGAIIEFFDAITKFFDAITHRIADVTSLNIGKDGITLLMGDLRDSDKISEEKKNKAVTALAQKREEDYVYRDWINAAVIAYIEKRYDTALRDFSQALQYAKTKEQVAKVLVDQGFMLGELGRFEEALQVYQRVNARDGKDIDPGVREPVARSLVPLLKKLIWSGLILIVIIMFSPSCRSSLASLQNRQILIIH